MKLLIFILALLYGAQSFANQKFYKWKDANGVIHYSEVKPHNQKTEEVKIKTVKSKPSVMLNQIEDSTAEPGTESEPTIEQRFAERRSEKEHNKARAKERQKACKEAKGNLAKYKQAVPYRRQDPKTGEYIYLEDNQREELLKEFKKTINKTCRK